MSSKFDYEKFYAPSTLPNRIKSVEIDLNTPKKYQYCCTFRQEGESAIRVLPIRWCDKEEE